MIKQKHLDLLLELDTDKNPHSGGALLDHLRGTHDLLQTWGNDQAVCVGGLFHSIYGTQAYRTQSASLEDRQRIRAVIGERAERLAFLFCVSNRSEFFEAVGKDGATIWNRIHEEAAPVTRDELRDLIEMELANYVEFMPRLPSRTMSSPDSKPRSSTTEASSPPARTLPSRQPLRTNADVCRAPMPDRSAAVVRYVGRSGTRAYA